MRLLLSLAVIFFVIALAKSQNETTTEAVDATTLEGSETTESSNATTSKQTRPPHPHRPWGPGFLIPPFLRGSRGNLPKHQHFVKSSVN